MEKESQMKKYVKTMSSRILYEDNIYLIGINNLEEGHNILVNDHYLFIGRGILSELARGNINKLESSLIEIGRKDVLEYMKTQDIHLSELGWALAKAVIEQYETY